MEKEIPGKVREMLERYDASNPESFAAQLRGYWLLFEPKSTNFIKTELRDLQENVGIPVAVLKAIGKEIAKQSKKDVDKYLPLSNILWEKFGREGKIVSIYPFGAMELVDPERIFPILEDLSRTCISWEDADQIAMYAVEPIIKKYPDEWLPRLQPWAEDENRWLRRIAITVTGRLAMKQEKIVPVCLQMAEQMLSDEEEVVRKAVSFGVRLAARGDTAEVRDFLAKHIPPEDRRSAWVLCDIIRSMGVALMPEFLPLLPQFEQWKNDVDVSAKEKRSIESAVKVLKKAEV
ncbi:MAG: DNA alkylation repair protein [Anaerolineaceae bacterium]|nr:DNA alkylation repair protein [Anaerolineaceae bacterium]